MTIKMRLKMKNRSHRYNINRPRPRHRPIYTKYKMYLHMIMITRIKEHQAKFEAQFIKTLSNSEAELKKSAAYKKSVYQSENHLKGILF